MSLSIPKASFPQVAKHPGTYMLLVAISVMWFFVYKFGDSSNQVNKNCEQEKAQLRTELSRVIQQKDDLVQSLLVKNGIINEIKKNTDSLVRNRVGNEAKKIVK